MSNKIIQLQKVDLLFIVDITASMGAFIDDARSRMKSILETLTTKYPVSLQVGMSLYRDHPSQGDPFVTAVFDLMDVDKIQPIIEEITVDGGGDAPEAVIDGIIDGVNTMSWRDKSRRIAFLIGDASAHGMIDNEECCTCGKTWGEAVSVTEKNRICIYSILLSNSDKARSNFRTLSNFTGGMLIEKANAMDAILSSLTEELENMTLDSKILEMISKDMKQEEICELLNIKRDDLESSKARIAYQTI